MTEDNRRRKHVVLTEIKDRKKVLMVFLFSSEDEDYISGPQNIVWKPEMVNNTKF